MNAKTLIPILLLTHAAAGFAGFMIARSLLKKDPAWEAENQKVAQRLTDLDATLKAQPAAAKDTTAPKAAEAAVAIPPADFKGGTASFDIQSHGMSRASFTSDAPLETIVGTTVAVSGTFRVDLGDITKSKVGDIAVDVSTLKTGIDMRDEHLQGEGWFDTAHHPKAIFSLKRVETQTKQLWLGHRVDAVLFGDLTIKGITKPVRAVASIGYHPFTKDLKAFGIESNILRVKANFEIKLSDFQMSAAVVGKKVAETVEVSLNITAMEETAE